MDRTNVLIGFVALVCLSIIEPKIYNKCELARELVNKYHFDRTFLSSWICLVQHESGYDTSKVSHYPPLAGPAMYRSYGIFQINNQTYCSNYSHGGICHVKCEDLARNDISKAVQCAKTIFDRDGFKVWYKWTAKCKGKKPEELPSLTECFKAGNRDFDIEDIDDIAEDVIENSKNVTIIFD